MAVTKFLARDLQAGIISTGITVGGALTGVNATDIITSASNHGLVAGSPVSFVTLSGGAGLSLWPTVYYVIAANLGATTFQLSATPGGAAVNFTTDITAGTMATATVIGGLTTLTHAPKTTETPTTTFTSAGKAEHLVGERTEEWTLSGLMLEDVATGSRDPGQGAVNTLSRQVGTTLSLGLFHLVSPGGNHITFQASAEVTLHSGGNNEAATWQGKLSVSGAATYLP